MEYTKLQFDRQVLCDFTYKDAVRNTKFVRNLKEKLEGEIFPASTGNSAFDIADSIACIFNEFQGNRFEDLWVSFETAAYVFDDPYYIEMYDFEHSADEDRYIAIGKVGDVLFVVFTERKETIRLISARLATNAERELYYDQNINY